MTPALPTLAHCCNCTTLQPTARLHRLPSGKVIGICCYTPPGAAERRGDTTMTGCGVDGWAAPRRRPCGQ